MRIKSVHLSSDFKRFTNLKIEDIPEAAKLVILLGPNGSGKSSLFEAFNFWIWRGKRSGSVSFHENYHYKISTEETHRNYDNLYSKINIEFHDNDLNPRQYNKNTEQLQKAFYIRTAYRHEATFSVSNISKLPEVLQDPDAPERLVNLEQRVTRNYQRLVWNAVHGFFNPDNKNIPAGDLVDNLVGEIRKAISNVFDDLTFVGIGEPTQEGTFFFDKGTSHSYRYENLSGGEKAAFDLLLDFVVKKQDFNDTVFCIDEPELHMHTKLQSKLLDELYRQLPDKCQLWIATHSIGMMRCAMQLYQQNPTEIVFLDFSGYNFDEAVVMRPTQVNRQFWRNIFSVAVDDLAELVAPSRVVFCEGKPKEADKPHKDKSFDSAVYTRIFQKHYPDTEFIPFGGVNDIEKHAPFVKNILLGLFSTIKVISLQDRDTHHEQELEEKRKAGIRILNRLELENYLWDDEILSKLCEAKGCIHLIPEILQAKQDLIAELPPNKQDDIKSIAGKLYNVLKEKLPLEYAGSNNKEFARLILAPLVTQDTNVYQELEQIIFGS